MSPRLSVVVCARNDRERIVPTLRSLVGQVSLDDVEILLVDGASDDDTPAVARRILGDLPGVVVDSRSDTGVFDAMNRSLRLARGDYVYFLNCGDTLASPAVIKELLDVLPVDPADAPLVVSRVRHHGGSGAPIVTDTVPFRLGGLLLSRQDYNHQAMVFARRAALAAGGFRLQYGVASDYDLILRLALLARPVETNLVLANYEGGGLSAVNPAQIPVLHAAARQEVFRLTGVGALLNRCYGAVQARRRGRIAARTVR
jgi:glycosyltransferase involved in cell wall biosynthesis